VKVSKSRNPACRHEGRWTERDVYATENEVITLVAAFVTALQPDYVIEVGTYLGDAAVAIATALHENGQGHLDTLEPDEARAGAARQRLSGLPGVVHVTTAQEFTLRQPPEFIWLDHRPKDRIPDLLRWWPHLPRGCIVGVHDTAPRWGVRPLVDKLALENRVRAIHLPTPRGVAFLETL